VPILKHPDVRRMLMTMKTYAEGLRALIYRTAYYADLARVAKDPEEKESCENMIDLLTPIVKAYSTDMGFRITEWAIQVHGGYGYCGEYPVEQLCRDVKLGSIYEGTNGIQAMDLVGRKLSLKRGALFMGWVKEVNEFIEKSHTLWETHPINIKRAKEGKLKANVVLTRDAGHLLPKFFNINQHYHVKFAALADMHAERGIAQLAGMDSSLLPPPSGNLQLDCEVRVKALLEALPSYDCFYIHLKGPDEPGHDGNCELKTQIISTIDKYFFGPLLSQISLKDNLLCVTTDHATPCSLKVHSDTPVPLLISGNSVGNGKAAKFCERECAKGSLGLIEHGYELMPRLMAFSMASRALSSTL